MLFVIELNWIKILKIEVFYDFFRELTLED